MNFDTEKLAYFRRENSNVFRFFTRKIQKLVFLALEIQSETFFDDFEPILSLKKYFSKLEKNWGCRNRP